MFKLNLSPKNFFAILLPIFCLLAITTIGQIPLPEHPRPDFQRDIWQNLNGTWAFEFDKNDVGINEHWENGKKNFSQKITVPFSWAAPLSGIKTNEADIAWYQKTINIPSTWNEKRTFITIGASDNETSVFIDGIKLGSNLGGYLPFSFELTQYLKYGVNQNITIRVDDKRREYALYGKQGYGDARGIWQTVYLESRGQNYIESLRFEPNIDRSEVLVKIKCSDPNNLSVAVPITVKIKSPKGIITAASSLKVGEREAIFTINIPNTRLWDLSDPYLYETDIQLTKQDLVHTYFGMRKISTTKLPNTDIPYVALNNKPIYLQLTLDQSYHPEGYYTFPTDAFMKNEIKLAKDIGLNGIRTHIKIDVPRKLYWADKLGLLVMSDLPNFWGEPDAQARAESERTMPGMIERDFNHPSIFSWILFNETWGLRSHITENGKKQSLYLPETQKWVTEMYQSAKKLDTTRLIEDNSICCGAGHTTTDINSWHEYLPGWDWERHLSLIDKNTYTGSEFHFEKGYKQPDNQPNINSECGNVWGYEGSTGDVDWSWDYHRMINTFRAHPKIAGWLYTEHHDVINEWNGYWRFDRSKKYTGLGDLASGMTDRDFHSEVYISTGVDISQKVSAGQKINIPLYISSYTNKNFGNELNLKVSLKGTDALGKSKTWNSFNKKIKYIPYLNQQLDSLSITAPNGRSIVNVALELSSATGQILHRNVYHLIVGGIANTNPKVLSLNPKQFNDAKWSKKQWNVMDSLKINGAGAGFFEYTFALTNKKLSKGSFVAELGAKQLFAKDMDNSDLGNQDYMLGAKVDPARNPNAYPMTDEKRFPSVVSVYANGIFVKKITLPDDPADHRGILSWHNQLHDKKLREAGSYGYRVQVDLPANVIAKAKLAGKVVIKLEVDKASNGGLAVYSADFGRYGLNPSLVLE